ncbi:MAG: hypothetical protein IPJ19_11460 [Planctomycetes bacterium]|nr:hypothetical protein [Planctomycetota bacterium]
MSSILLRSCTALCALSSLLAAQSPVKPLPAAAQPSAIALALVAPQTFGAQDARSLRGPFDEVAHLPLDGDAAHFDLDTFFLGESRTSFQGAPGSVRTVRGGWDAHLGWRSGEASGLSLNLHTEATFYSFTDATGLAPGTGSDAPLNDVYETSLGSTLCVRAGERTTWFSSAAFTLAGEDNAALGDALTVCALSGVRYRVRDDVTLEGGIAALTLLGDDSWVVPFVGFDWRVGAGWRMAVSGPRVELAKDFGEHWTLAASAAYQMRQYRLNANNPLPSGVLRDQEIDLGLELAWRPGQDTRLSIGAGMVGWRELQFLDHGGALQSETEADPAPFVALRLHFGF